jgi:hypothetical protein
MLRYPKSSDNLFAVMMQYKAVTSFLVVSTEALL